MKILTSVAVAATAVAIVAAAQAARSSEPSLAEVRVATERFQNVDVALAEGDVRDPGNICETAEMMGRAAALGTMGVHYFRPDLLGISGPPNPRVNGTGTPHRLQQAGHPHLRAAGGRIDEAGRGREPRLPESLARGREQGAAELPGRQV